MERIRLPQIDPRVMALLIYRGLVLSVGRANFTLCVCGGARHKCEHRPDFLSNVFRVGASEKKT